MWGVKVKQSLTKKLLFLAAIFTAVFMLLTVSAYAEDYGNISYSKIEPEEGDTFEAHIEITGFRTNNELTEKVVVIPETIEDIPVTKINASAFSGKEIIEEVIIPNSVTSIGNSAFCNSKSIKLVVIPDGVTYIGESAFQGCDALETVIVGNGVTQIDSLAFKNCSALKYVKLGSSLEEIGSGAFYGCESLKNVVIPASVKEIDTLAFGCVNGGDTTNTVSDFMFYTDKESAAVTNYLKAENLNLAVNAEHKSCAEGSHKLDWKNVRKASAAYIGIDLAICPVCHDVLTQDNTDIEKIPVSIRDIITYVVATVIVIAFILYLVIYVKKSKKNRAAAIEAYNAGKPLPGEEQRIKEQEKRDAKLAKKRAKQEAILKKYEDK